jgi:hypothetical protein
MAAVDTFGGTNDANFQPREDAIGFVFM